MGAPFLFFVPAPLDPSLSPTLALGSMFTWNALKAAGVELDSMRRAMLVPTLGQSATCQLTAQKEGRPEPPQ